MSSPAIGFIGIGALARGLALALAQHGYRIAGTSSRSAQSAQWLAQQIPGCRAFPEAQALAGACDLVFITTPDVVIGQVAASLRWRPGQQVVHCCGAASVELLEPAAAQGAATGALHPFQTFAGLDSPADAAARLQGVTFAVAGAEPLAALLSQMARDLGGRPISLSDGDRPLYHASAILACGYLAALLQCAARIWQEMGFTSQEGLEALYPLARATLENIARLGIVPSVTGPVVRGDAATVAAHLEALSQRLPELAPVYAALTQASLPIAQARGVAPAPIAYIAHLVETYAQRG
ncbi:MAG: DUF2520 domain-containing protein [SAR202 cluster bacterium]|nr:DUF2520 domain-containing protein [SAR202 cluster bacterium]